MLTTISSGQITVGASVSSAITVTEPHPADIAQPPSPLTKYCVLLLGVTSNVVVVVVPTKVPPQEPE